ncbi:guanine deaminase [Streptomonospora sp. S1-112]|uniref:Guanine deaminase n=1 Tax=Streptomonospora mangrovi TaxID=2883123 RepID=A0A9X3NU79_9ACTN|nr:guanine deaminase [Streptomonospora mangrovi]MDA0564171.1 guanine deaminase [Streptomonospora mangrovi]
MSDRSARAPGRVSHRGIVLHFTGDPDDPEHGAEHTHLYEDGVLVVEDGRVVHAGRWHDRPRVPGAPERVEDHRGDLILPGFVDTHVHAAQIDVMGTPGAQLLPWLTQRVYPAELRFRDPAYAAAAARDLLGMLLAAGTTTAVVSTSTHPDAAEAFFAEALALDLRVVAGKELMDACGTSSGGPVPDALLDPTWEKGHEATVDLARRFHGRRGAPHDPYGSSRIGYCVSPRTAATSTLPALEAAGALYRESAAAGEPLWAQGHLMENRYEADRVLGLLCGRGVHARSYLDVFDRCGLVGPRSVWAHCVWLGEDYPTTPASCPHRPAGGADLDRELLRERGAGVAFCPTSNLYLGSGFFPLHRLRGDGVPVGLGTDIGAGTGFSPLRALHDAYTATVLGNGFPAERPTGPRRSLSALRGLYLATRGGAEALGLQGVIGGFSPGCEADFTVLDLGATPALRRRMDTAHDVHDMLFALMVLGDERSVRTTYVTGRPLYRRGADPYTPYPT